MIAIRASDDVLAIAGQLKTKETLFTVKEVPAKDHQAAKMAATVCQNMTKKLDISFLPNFYLD